MINRREQLLQREHMRDRAERESDREAAERMRMPEGVPPEAQRLIRSLQERNAMLERQIRNMQAGFGNREQNIQAELKNRARAIGEREEQWQKHQMATHQKMGAMIDQMEKMQDQIADLRRATRARQGE